MSGLHWLFVCRRGPYAGSLARSGLDMAFAAAAFDQQVELLFMDDGVWQLLPGQAGSLLGQKDFDRQLAAAPLYGIAGLRVDAESLQRRSLTVGQLALPVQLTTRAELPQLLQRADRIFDF